MLAFRASLFCLLCSTLVYAKMVRVRFEVEVPRVFSQREIFLSGNDPNLGKWEPQSIRLERQKSNTFSAEVELPAATPIEYKLNLGKWFNAEVSESGKELVNRTLKCEGNCTQLISVANFRLHQMHAIPRSASENIFYWHDIYAEAFGNYRNIAIYLPPQYFAEPSRRFPVLYALDGNALFDFATMPAGGKEWGLDETLNLINQKGSLPPFIVVGIYNTSRRTDEYLPCGNGEQGGMAKLYAEFILQQIKPFIDGNYRSLADKENTFLMGASFGGNFTLFAATQLGNHFSKFIAMSPALFWADHCQMAQLKRIGQALPDKLWIDMGDKEGDSNQIFANGVKEVEEAYSILVGAGLKPNEQIVKFTDVGGMHNEVYWGARIEKALQFIFSKKQAEE